jgi:hypothetical protein
LLSLSLSLSLSEICVFPLSPFFHIWICCIDFN